MCKAHLDLTDMSSEVIKVCFQNICYIVLDYTCNWKEETNWVMYFTINVNWEQFNI